MVLTVEKKLHIITRNLQEVLGGEILKKKLTAGHDIKIYWGTAPTGKPHIAYFVPITKIADFLHAGCEVTILLADLHAYLDNLKAPWELLEYRVKYYENMIKAMLEQINVPIEKLKFVRGTSYQLTQKYTLDTYRLFTIATEHDCKKAGSEVVKQVESPYMSGLMYPALQALDEEYLCVDAQFGGIDQRKIFTFSEKYMPKMGYEKRIHLMNPMVAGLTGDKMSSSNEDSKIDLLDDEISLQSKIKKSFCEEGNIQSNGVLSFSKHVIFPIMEYHSSIKHFKIKRTKENGGDIIFNCYQQLEDMFSKKLIHPLDLKNAVFYYINRLLAPIRDKFNDNTELMTLLKNAYPPTITESNCKKPSQSLKNDPTNFVMQCGKMLSIEKHPSLDDIFVAHIDLGSAKKIACIKSHGYESFINEIINKSIVVITNVKEYNFKGIKVNSIVLLSKKCEICPSTGNFINKVSTLNAPIDAELGELVYFEGHIPISRQNNTYMFNINKTKFDGLFELIEIDDEGHAFYEGHELVTRTGSIVSLLRNAKIV